MRRARNSTKAALIAIKIHRRPFKSMKIGMENMHSRDYAEKIVFDFNGLSKRGH